MTFDPGERQRVCRPVFIVTDVPANGRWPNAFPTILRKGHRLQPTVRLGRLSGVNGARSLLKRAGCPNAAKPEFLNHQQGLS
jgi:hypothetical protein